MRNFIELTDLSSDELNAVLDRTVELRAAWRESRMPRSLAGQRVALWFHGNGFRNRIAFEVGARAMGADVSFIPGELGVNEPIEDIGHYLANWFTMLVIRCRDHADLVTVARDAGIPTINARTTWNHPCEIVGDLAYVRSVRGSLDGLRVIFVGEATNLCHSWFEAAQRAPIEVVQVAPDGYRVSDEELRARNEGAVGRIATSRDLDAELRPNVDLIYTDCWPKATGDEREAVRRAFLPYQITAARVKAIAPNGLFLPCPPVTRGEEVSEDAVETPQCRNYQAKEYLLHAQNSIMELVAGGRPRRRDRPASAGPMIAGLA